MNTKTRGLDSTILEVEHNDKIKESGDIYSERGNEGEEGKQRKRWKREVRE